MVRGLMAVCMCQDGAWVLVGEERLKGHPSFCPLSAPSPSSYLFSLPPHPQLGKSLLAFAILIGITSGLQMEAGDQAGEPFLFPSFCSPASAAAKKPGA